MCGIAGLLKFKSSITLDDIQAVKRIMDEQVHRGPDDSGLYQSDHMVMGHRRLAIIDLSSSGRQPMSNKACPECSRRNETVWVTYNGEIYNYIELGNQLRVLGHQFKSNSDTEVIIHGYGEWGIEGLLKRLRGMFAFALYDSRPLNSELKTHNFKLYLARDRFGIKPIYFYCNDGIFIFASEIKGILSSKLVPREIDFQAIGLFLHYGSIPSPKTIYRGISALEPGHFLMIDKKEIEKVRYYHLKNAFLDTSLENISERDAIENVRSCLTDTIKCHLVSDVPVGAFLSGGIDSTSIVGLIHELGHQPIKTVSIIFPHTFYDESNYSKISAKKFNTEHTEVEIDVKEMMDHAEKIFYAMDQPTIDGVNTYFVSWAASRAGIKVALSGVGGDEIFWGYPSFIQIPRLYKLSKIISFVPFGRKTASFILRNSNGSRRAKLYSIFAKESSIPKVYLNYRGLFTEEQIQRLLKPDFTKEVMEGVDPISYLQECSEISDESNQVSMLETTSYMANQLLRDTDAFSMAHSLEVRVPFVDHELVELLARLPERFKIGRDMPKRLLIKALNNHLPETIVHRPKKGFTFPFDLWMHGEMRGFVEAKLNGSTLFNKPYIQGLLDDFYNNRIHWSRIWGCVVLSHWVK